jgi:hypothetical protein
MLLDFITTPLDRFGDGVTFKIVMLVHPPHRLQKPMPRIIRWGRPISAEVMDNLVPLRFKRSEPLTI